MTTATSSLHSSIHLDKNRNLLISSTVHIFILSGLTINCFNTYQSNFVLFVGLLAVGSKTLLSYTAYKYDEIIKGQDAFRIGRDVTTFILLIGLILNVPYFTLIILTIIFNFEIIKRIFILKDKFV